MLLKLVIHFQRADTPAILITAKDSFQNSYFTFLMNIFTKEFQICHESYIQFVRNSTVSGVQEIYFNAKKIFHTKCEIELNFIKT